MALNCSAATDWPPSSSCLGICVGTRATLFWPTRADRLPFRGWTRIPVQESIIWHFGYSFLRPNVVDLFFSTTNEWISAFAVSSWSLSYPLKMNRLDYPVESFFLYDNSRLLTSEKKCLARAKKRLIPSCETVLFFSLEKENTSFHRISVRINRAHFQVIKGRLSLRTKDVLLITNEWQVLFLV